MSMLLQSRPGLIVTGADDLDPAEIERKMEGILNRLMGEYHPGLAAEMQFPEAESANLVLSAWKASGQALDAGEAVMDVLSRLNDFFKANPDMPAKVFFKSCGELSRLRESYRKSVPLHAARWALVQFDKLKQQENFLTFDDLLKNVLKAVREDHNPLCSLVRKQYRAAIVDEFQDTDPVQYEIFLRIFGQRETGHILFFVGDPKQAIYGFRGGDTATYRVARDFVEHNGSQYSLNKNFRSSGILLETVNDIFAKCPRNGNGAETVFADGAVEFHPVIAGRKGPGLIDSKGNEDPRPFKFCWLTVSDAKEASPVGLKETIARSICACAEDIALLLNSQWLNPDTKKTLRPNDIAVLVPDNLDAKKMRDELKKRNVPCVIPKSENVFKTAAAKHLKTVLKAVGSPSDPNLISEAMLTPLLGFTLDDLIAQHAAVQATGASVELNCVQEKMRQLSAIWQQDSFLKMFQEMLRLFDVRVKLLKRNDGERILTDLLQLRELIHQKIRETGLSSSGVMSYLNTQENEDDSEEKETMMETDRAAVVISTVHSSKGLEYPVVVLPLMFKRSYSYRSGQTECYHDPEGRLIMNLAPDSEAAGYIEQEKKQEQMRLLYVALTRAKYSCYLYWGLISDNSDSGFYDQTSLDWLFPTVSGHQFETLKAELPQLERCEKRLIFTDQTGLTPWHPEIGEAENLAFREWQGRIDPDYRFTSFTAMSGKNDNSDGLDYDDEENTGHQEKAVGIFRIPPGAQTGNAWHDIMEEIDFTAFDPNEKTDRDFIEQKMELFGVLYKGMPRSLREEYVKLTGEMIVHLLNTPLQNADGETFHLREIPRNERLSELKFNYRFHQGVHTGKLVGALSDYAEKTFGLKETEIAIRDLNISGGFLTGALDLLFRRNGKLYIADWKSNRINGKASGFDNNGVKGEMADHTYYLQYLIYTVAVVKYLELHLHHALSETEYDRLFGGVFYFFMRGVDQTRPGQGVFTARPPYALIRDLGQLIG